MMITVHVIGSHSSKLHSSYANSVKSVLLFPAKLVTGFLFHLMEMDILIKKQQECKVPPNLTVPEL